MVRMEERYWLRHASLKGHQGPFEKKDLGAAIDAGAFPRDSEVLRDMGVSEAKRDESNSWIPVTELLGLDAAPGHDKPVKPASVWPEPGTRSTPEPKETQADRLAAIRRGSAYPNTRFFIQVGMVVMVIGELLVMIFGLTRTQPLGAEPPIISAIVNIIITIVAANVLLATLDLADAAVRQSADSRND